MFDFQRFQTQSVQKRHQEQQFIGSSDAKAVIAKQIKMTALREVSEPPPNSGSKTNHDSSQVFRDLLTSDMYQIESVNEDMSQLSNEKVFKQAIKQAKPVAKTQVRQPAKIIQPTRKIRSKSPAEKDEALPTKNYFALKVKKYYKAMVPAFTNKKRQHTYYNAPKQGFNYINQDMEKELYVFQTQIENKFSKSDVNRNYKFPLALPSENLHLQ